MKNRLFTMDRIISVLVALVFMEFALSGTAWGTQELMARADALWPQRADLAKVEQSAVLYRGILANDPANFDAAWKLSRSMCWIAEHTKGDKRLEAATEAVEAAKKAMELNPNDPASHFYLAVSYGYYGHAKGIWRMLYLASTVEKELQQVIAMDPDFMGGWAYLALGRFYQFMPGHLKTAEGYYRTTLQISPKLYGAHLYMAQVYIKQGRKEEARKLLEEIIAGPAQPGYEPEYLEWKKGAKYYMKKVEEMKQINSETFRSLLTRPTGTDRPLEKR